MTLLRNWPKLIFVTLEVLVIDFLIFSCCSSYDSGDVNVYWSSNYIFITGLVGVDCGHVSLAIGHAIFGHHGNHVVEHHGHHVVEHQGDHGHHVVELHGQTVEYIPQVQVVVPGAVQTLFVEFKRLVLVEFPKLKREIQLSFGKYLDMAGRIRR